LFSPEDERRLIETACGTNLRASGGAWWEDGLSPQR
jgi:hypothetical protein